MELEEMQRRFVGVEFDEAEFTVDREEALEFARACGETDPRFVDPDHADFQAPPTFTAKFVSRRVMPDEFPADGFRRAFDGGKCVTVHAPVRVGTRLLATSKIADVYRKTGRSGGMVFIVHRMEFRDPQGTLLSTVDWRLIQKEAA